MSFNTMSLNKIQMSLKYNLHKISTYPNAHANAKTSIFDIQYQGNRFEFGIILIHFWSSTIWAIQIQFSFYEFENPKNPCMKISSK